MGVDMHAPESGEGAPSPPIRGRKTVKAARRGAHMAPTRVVTGSIQSPRRSRLGTSAAAAAEWGKLQRLGAVVLAEVAAQGGPQRCQNAGRPQVGGG